MVFTASNELVFINFYAEWCRFSNLLQPIFDNAADLVSSSEFYLSCRLIAFQHSCLIFPLYRYIKNSTPKWSLPKSIVIRSKRLRHDSRLASIQHWNWFWMANRPSVSTVASDHPKHSSNLCASIWKIRSRSSPIYAIWRNWMQRNVSLSAILIVVIWRNTATSEGSHRTWKKIVIFMLDSVRLLLRCILQVIIRNNEYMLRWGT